MKKFYIVKEGIIVFGPSSKEEAELEAERMIEEDIDEILEDWGCCDPEDCSPKRRMEAAYEAGYEVLSESECSEYLDDYDDDDYEDDDDE